MHFPAPLTPRNQRQNGFMSALFASETRLLLQQCVFTIPPTSYARALCSLFISPPEARALCPSLISHVQI
eukprot:3744054-Rhodomonas_salina.2